MKLTEYQWEQRKKDRELHVNFLLNSGNLAEHDRQNGFDVEFECASLSEWKGLVATRESQGWELADYGQAVNIVIISGYFKKPKTNQPDP